MFKLSSNSSIVRIVDSALIPQDERNSDYQQYLAWLAEGNTPEPADLVNTPPISVSPRQIRQALTAMALRSVVEGAIASADQDMKDWYGSATAFEENHPMVSVFASALGISGKQVHALFALAASL